MRGIFKLLAEQGEVNTSERSQGFGRLQKGLDSVQVFSHISRLQAMEQEECSAGRCSFTCTEFGGEEKEGQVWRNPLVKKKKRQAEMLTKLTRSETWH